MATPPSTSAGLLAQLAWPDNDAAWERFVRLYQPYAEFLCRKAGLQSADADEVVSRVLASLARTLPRFRYDPALRFRGYLTRTIVNAIRGYRSEFGQRPAPVGGHAELEALSSAFEETLAAGLEERVLGTLEMVDRAFARVREAVSAESWAAFQRTALDGADAASVAAELGKSVAAVYMAKSRTLRAVRSELTKLASESEEAHSWLSALANPNSAASSKAESTPPESGSSTAT